MNKNHIPQGQSQLFCSLLCSLFCKSPGEKSEQTGQKSEQMGYVPYPATILVLRFFSGLANVHFFEK
nr:MAG TPA: hypothetical protein [Caudoviricetes sp.]